MTVDVRIEPELTESTEWREGRFHIVQAKQRLLFGQVYEDVAVERNCFAKGERVFCIASAGCTALSLCEHHEVVACDINPAQIEYVTRRLAGGPTELGVADKVMTYIRGFMPLAGWSRTKVLRFLEMQEPDAQASYFHDQLDNWRFRYGLDLLLSPLSLRSAYSPSLLSCLPARFGAVMRGRMRRCFARHPNRTNPYAHALLLGSSEPVGGVPFPAPNAIARIELVLDDAAAYLERCPAGSFAGLALSNILDGTGPRYEQRLMSAVRRAARPEAVVVRRSFSEPPADLPTNRAADDRSMIWGIVDVRTVEES